MVRLNKLRDYIPGKDGNSYLRYRVQKDFSKHSLLSNKHRACFRLE
jgi:hypothetical protein